MKFLHRIFVVVLLVSTGYVADAQYCGRNGGTGSGPSICTAGTTLTVPGFSPPEDSVPCAVRGVPYSQTVQVKVPTTVTSNGTTYPLNYIKIDSIGNLPCGLCWATNKASNQFNGNEQFCIRISGTTYDNPGQFKMKIIVDANVTAFGFPVTQTNQDASAAGLRFFTRVQAANGTCTPIDTLATGNTSMAVGAAPSSAVTAGGSLTFCSGGSVTLTATEAAGTAYQWFNGTNSISGATSRTYTATTAGSYTVYIEKGCHAVTSAAQVVVVNAAPTVSVTPAGPIVLCTGSSQVLTATASAGTLQWYNAAGAISGQTGTTYTATASGSYHVVATSNSCPGTSNTVSVSITGTPPTPTVTATRASLCPGQTDTLDAGAGYTTYAWSNSLGSAQKAYPTTAGTYTVTVTNGVCSGTGSISIAASQTAATPTVTASATTLCAGDTATLTSTQASTYLWSTGATTRSIQVTAAGSYSVTISNVNQCGTAASPPIVISVTARPNASVTPVGPVIICGSGSQVLTATGGGTYSWLKNGVAISPAQTAATYTATTAGNYSVIVTANGCSKTSNVVSVQIGSALSPTITANHTYICTGATDTLDAGAGYTSYAWSNGLGNTRFAYPTTAGTYAVTVTNGTCSGSASIIITAQGPTPTPTILPGGPTTFCQGGSVVLTSSAATGNVWSTAATTQAITAMTSGSYTVTNNNGCGAATSAATVVTVNAIPNAQITPSGSTIICGGSTQVLTATPAGATYSWLDNGSPVAGQIGNTYSATTTGAYRAVVSLNGCSDTSNTATITVSGTPPTPVITATAQTVCPGTIDTLNVGAGYTSYTWSGTLGSSSTATVTAGGTYTVTVANGVCQGTASITINQGTGSTVPTISVQGNLNICGADSVILTSSSASGNVWSNTATSQSITVFNAGIFYVTVSGTCGSAVSLSDTVTTHSFPIVELGVDTGTCAGDSLTLNAGANGSVYLWSNGTVGNTTTVSNTGEYYVSVTNQGCTTVDSVHTTFDAVPLATFTADVSGILTASTGASYQWKKNGVPIPGATSQTYDANVSGTANYTVIITSASGYCSATSASQLITITGISELAQSLSAMIYPNPTTGIATITYTLAHSEEMEVFMTDMTGRTIKTLYTGSQPDGDYQLVADLTTLTGGVYFVNFRTAEGTVVRKVVKD